MSKSLLLIGLLSFFCCQAIADIVQGRTDPWPPYVINEHEGLTIELLNAAFNVKGDQLEVVLAPWNRVYRDVLNANADALITAWLTDERKKLFHHSEAYYSNRLVFIKRAGDKFQYKDLKSLDGKLVGVISGYAYNEAFNKATNFHKPNVSNLITNLNALVAKRIDLTLDDHAVALYTIMNNSFDSGMIEFVEKPLSTNGVYVLVSFKNPKHKRIIDNFNYGLKQIKQSGLYDKILKKYGL